MFEDLIPSAPAATPAPPPGLFDDLIPAGAAGGGMFAVAERTDGLASPRSTPGTDPGDERIGASGRNNQPAAPIAGRGQARMPSEGLGERSGSGGQSGLRPATGLRCPLSPYYGGQGAEPDQNIVRPMLDVTMNSKQISP